jgi:hypothetical protein
VLQGQTRLRVVLGCVAVGAVLVLLRLPGLFEPAWSADEGAYANIGRSLDLGGTLYSGIWDNKPPGMYWLSAAAMAGGASALRMHLALFAIVALATVLVGLIGWRLRGAGTGLLAALLFAVVASVPNFAGDQLNAEMAGALPALGGMLLLLWRTPITLRRAVAAGLLLGAALLFKATFVADVLAAVAVAPLLAVAGAQRRRPSRQDAAVVAALLGGVLLLCAAAAAAVALRGSLSALVDVLVHHDVRYAQWGQLAGPDGVPPPAYSATPSALLRALAYSRLLAVVAAGGLLAVLLARRRHAAGAVASFWLACDLAAAVVDNRALTHYVQQMEGALALAAALAAVSLWRQRDPVARALALAALPAMWLALVGALFLPRAEAALATGHPLPPLTRENSSGRQLPSYYANALRLATGRMSLDGFQATFTGAVYPDDVRVAAFLAALTRSGDRIAIWGERSPWVYALADRLPATRFVWLDSAYHLYPDSGALLVADLQRTPPAALLAQQPPTAALQEFLDSHGYTRAAQTPDGTLWLQPAQPSR